MTADQRQTKLARYARLAVEKSALSADEYMLTTEGISSQRHAAVGQCAVEQGRTTTA
jgi:hypothetical protein